MEKVITNTHICAALIRAGSGNLSIENAIKSVIRNHQYIHSLFIESKVFDKSHSIYPEWDQDLQTLGKLNLTPTWQTEFNPELVETDAIFEINPGHVLLESAFITLYNRMGRSPGYDHYAISSSITINQRPNDSFLNPNTWLSVLGFGLSFFFWVMDSWRYIWSLGRYHRWADLKVHTLVRTYPKKKYMSPYKSCRWLFWTGIDTCSPMSGDVKQVINNDINGFYYTHEYVQSDSNLSFTSGIRRWLLYFFMVGFYTHSLWTIPYWTGYLTTPVGSLTLVRWIVFAFYGVQIIPVLTIVFVNINDSFPLRSSGVLCLFFPIFAMLSPLVLLWAKLFTIRLSRELKYIKQD